MISLFPHRTVAVEIIGFSIHWYGVLYLIAFLLGYALLPRLQSYRGLQLIKDDYSRVLTAVILGVLVGGRLGYVFFYQPSLLQTPWEIFKVWNGGMASHGGMIGVLIAFYIIARKLNISWFALADVAIVPVAIGLALGRFGNFINQELYGTVSSLPWAIEIPGVEGLRHPLPLYGIIKNLLIASCCYLHLQRSKIPGTTAALFLILYGTLRCALEYYRHQHFSGLGVFGIRISRGQLLTLPVLLSGVGIYAVLWRNDSKKV